MRVQGVEIEGTAKKWAEKYFKSVAPHTFKTEQVESWAFGTLAGFGLPPAKRTAVAHRLADRFLHWGRKNSLWSHRNGRWHRVAR